MGLFITIFCKIGLILSQWQGWGRKTDTDLVVCGVIIKNYSNNGMNNPDSVVCEFNITIQIHSVNGTIICVVIETTLDVRVLHSKTKTDPVFRILW